MVAGSLGDCDGVDWSLGDRDGEAGSLGDCYWGGWVTVMGRTGRWATCHCDGEDGRLGHWVTWGRSGDLSWDLGLCLCCWGVGGRGTEGGCTSLL